jgi:hypothetical protein
MDEQTERLELPIVETSPSTNSPVYLLISGLFIAAALVFAGVGWYIRSTTTPTMLVLLAVMLIIS